MLGVGTLRLVKRKCSRFRLHHRRLSGDSWKKFITCATRTWDSINSKNDGTYLRVSDYAASCENNTLGIIVSLYGYNHFRSNSCVKNRVNKLWNRQKEMNFRRVYMLRQKAKKLFDSSNVICPNVCLRPDIRLRPCTILSLFSFSLVDFGVGCAKWLALSRSLITEEIDHGVKLKEQCFRWTVP